MHLEIHREFYVSDDYQIRVDGYALYRNGEPLEWYPTYNAARRAKRELLDIELEAFEIFMSDITTHPSVAHHCN